MSDARDIAPGFTGPPLRRTQPRPARPTAPSMSMGTAISRCFRKIFVFSGRARRAEHWKFVLAVMLVQVLIAVVRSALFGPRLVVDPITHAMARTYDGGQAGAIFGLLTWLPLTAVAWRRLHDCDRTGWWCGGSIVVWLLLSLSLFGQNWWRAILGFDAPEVAPIVSPVALLAGVIAVVALSLWLIIQLARAGTPGPNRFDPDPLEVTP